MSIWQMVLLEPAKNILEQIGQFLVNILLVIIILIIGWIVSGLIKALVVRILRAIKVDVLSERIELDNIFAKGGIKYSLSELIGVVIYWLALLVTFVVAISSIGLTIAADLLSRIVLYVPNIIAAIFILILGMFVGSLLKNIVQTMTVNAGVTESKLLGKIVEAVIMIFVIIIALEQLEIGAKTLHLALSMLLGALGLGAALAFGLGCKDLAGKYTAEFIEKLKNNKK